VKQQHCFGDRGSTDVKRQIGYSECDYEEVLESGFMRRVYNQSTEVWGEVLVGVKNGRARIRYPVASGGRVNYLDGASQELLTLCALFVCGLTEAGILADCLEECFPVHREACDILRKYERLLREKANGD
jgi:hypothetical protein